MRLERIDDWERNASRGERPSHSISELGHKIHIQHARAPNTLQVAAGVYAVVEQTDDFDQFRPNRMVVGNINMKARTEPGEASMADNVLSQMIPKLAVGGCQKVITDMFDLSGQGYKESGTVIPR